MKSSTGSAKKRKRPAVQQKPKGESLRGPLGEFYTKLNEKPPYPAECSVARSRTGDRIYTYGSMVVKHVDGGKVVFPDPDGDPKEWDRCPLTCVIPDEEGSGYQSLVYFPVHSTPVHPDTYESFDEGDKLRCVWDEVHNVWQYCGRSTLDEVHEDGTREEGIYLANLVRHSGDKEGNAVLVLDWEYDPSKVGPNRKCILVSTKKTQRGQEWLLDSHMMKCYGPRGESDEEESEEEDFPKRGRGGKRVAVAADAEQRILEIAESSNKFLKAIDENVYTSSVMLETQKNELEIVNKNLGSIHKLLLRLIQVVQDASAGAGTVRSEIRDGVIITAANLVRAIGETGRAEVVLAAEAAKAAKAGGSDSGSKPGDVPPAPKP